MLVVPDKSYASSGTSRYGLVGVSSWINRIRLIGSIWT